MVLGQWVDFTNLRTETYSEGSRIPVMAFGTAKEVSRTGVGWLLIDCAPHDMVKKRESLSHHTQRNAKHANYNRTPSAATSRSTRSSSTWARSRSRTSPGRYKSPHAEMMMGEG